MDSGLAVKFLFHLPVGDSTLHCPVNAHTDSWALESQLAIGIGHLSAARHFEDGLGPFHLHQAVLNLHGTRHGSRHLLEGDVKCIPLCVDLIAAKVCNVLADDLQASEAM